METIQAATIDDLGQLADLLAILFSQEADFTPDREKQLRGLRAIIESPALGQIFVARPGAGARGQVLGMVNLLFTISTAEGGRVCWLEDVVVRPDHRGRGLGSRLLAFAIDFARAGGCTRIALLTDRSNQRAMKLYERHGFCRSQMAALRLQL